MTSDQPPQRTDPTERRWSDPLDVIAPERQSELKALTDRQRG
jgi:hypothetical protein